MRPACAGRRRSRCRRVVFSSSTDLERTGFTAGSRVEAAGLSGLTGAAESLFATLFPADCRLCGAPLIRISRLPVCQDCLSSVRRIAGGLCSICGEAIFSPYAGLDGQGESLCGVCRGLKPAYVQAASYGSYEGGLRELIDLLKYERVRPAAHILGRMLGEAITRLAPEFGEQPPRVIPVPLHLRKFDERGFNQSQLIAQAALRMKPAALDLRLADGVLKRTRATLSERRLSRAQRRENMRGAFAIEKPVEVAGQQILLIDDVFATGTTVSECARLLRRAGATRIWVATVARTLSGEASGARVASHKDEDELVPLARAAHV